MRLVVRAAVLALLPFSPHAVLRDLHSALTGKLSHADWLNYNAVQQGQ